MLPLVMFLNGLAVMVLEMVGARLLAPELGTSTVVWTSLIGVILASLSLGYWFGGKLADAFLATGASSPTDRPSLHKARSVLAGILVAASGCVLITALAHEIILRQLGDSSLPLHFLAVCAALALFAVPGALCGMVSPYATRLAITRSETSGTVIGRLNAISTIGSIVGTFLGGFVLISWFGSKEITLAVAACLLLAATLVKARPLLLKILLAFAITVLTIQARLTSLDAMEQGIDATLETPYSTLRILTQPYRNQPARLLLTNPRAFQSGCYLEDPAELLFDYTRFYALGSFLYPTASRILMLGGGGYSIPKWLLAGRSGLHSPAFSLDVVELDPGMTGAAERYFSLPVHDNRLHIFHEDARRLLNRTARSLEMSNANSGPYQLIFADIFNSFCSIPFHVGTTEAARKIHTLLAADGILIMNIIASIEGDSGRLFRSIHSAFADVFSDIHIFAVRTPYHGAEIQNIILMASKTPRTLPNPHAPSISPAIAALLRKEWPRPIPSDCPPLMDNYAPVERYALSLSR